MKYRLHGANPSKLYQQFEIKIPDKIIDFSTNTNVLVSEVDFSIEIEQLSYSYPCEQSNELLNVISHHTGIDKQNLIATNGINEAIYILASRYKNERIGIVSPTYPEYQRAIEAFDNEVVHFFDIDEIEDVKMLFLCNPNNPTGSYISSKVISNLASSLSKKGIDLVVDESYIDFLFQDDERLRIEEHENLYLLRSMTKIYHLSGLRIGYMISRSANIKEIRRKQPTWSVNSIAQEIGKRFINDVDFLQQTKEFYLKEVKQLINNIRSIGYTVLDSSVNFFLIEVDNDEEIIKFLLTKGIVVRHTRNYPTLDGRYIRVACRSKKDNEILLANLRRYYHENK